MVSADDGFSRSVKALCSFFAACGMCKLCVALSLKASHCDVFASRWSARSPFETWSFSVAPKGTSSNSLFLRFLELPSSATGGGRSRHLRAPIRNQKN